MISIIKTIPRVMMLEKDYLDVTKFLNRILGMPVGLQNELFQYYTATLANVVIQAKRTGQFNSGLQDMDFEPRHVTGKVWTFIISSPLSPSSITFTEMRVSSNARTYGVLSGSIMSVWMKLEVFLENHIQVCDGLISNEPF